MRPVVKAIRKKNKKRADGAFPVYVRITANRQSAFIHTKVWVKSADWNERKCLVRASDHLSDSKNNTIHKLVTRANLAAENQSTAAGVKAELVKGYSGVIQFLDAYIEDLGKQEKFWEVRKFKVTRKKMIDALSESISWKRLDHGALVKLEAHMRKTCGNSANTIYNEMKRVRRIINQAHTEGLISADDNPFNRYKMPKTTIPVRRVLSRDEVLRLEAAELEPDSKLKLAGDVFLFSYYSGGLRFSDLCSLRKSDIQSGRVVTQTMKTGAAVSNKLPAPALSLLESYKATKGDLLFPLIHQSKLGDPMQLRAQISSKNVMVNKRLKAVAKKAGIDPDGLTMHVARHTVANHAQSASTDVRAIQHMLSHAKLEMTQ